MYPPKVKDKQIRELIHALAAAGELPSGAALRAVLAQRFGSPGGVTRIYRLLNAERTARTPADSSAPGWQSVQTEVLKVELQQLRERLQAADQRDRAHQAYWQLRIGELQLEVKNLEHAAQSKLCDPAAIRDILQEIQAAETKVGRLEVLLRAFGPAAGTPGLTDPPRQQVR